MLELLWLLLPVAAASGWWAAKRSANRQGSGRLNDLSSVYFKGLNYLLNEQPDKAIEVFLRLVEVDSETVETHLALGNLFRRRGEVDRAIRIHQNLIARPTLDREQRAQGLLELGLDYMRAGLLDRAESLFQELIEMDDHSAAALANLVDIYQQEKDWDKAIHAQRRLEAVTGTSLEPVVAQYYCELAEQARNAGDLDKAMQMVKRALKGDPRCVRASLIEGHIAAVAGDYKAAVTAYLRVEDQDPRYLTEVIAPLQESYQRLGKPDQMLEYLQHLVREHQGVSATLALADLVRQTQGEQIAAQFISAQLHEQPSVRGLERLIELNLAGSNGVARDNLLTLKSLAGKLLEDKPVYQCEHCGFSGKSIHWQCPGCKHWSTLKPIQGVVGE
jgi:lipopolysaccharide biosynthesis regulator YciM